MEKFYRSADDFFSDESFQRYVLHSTPADTAHWESWLQRHPEMAEEASQAVMMIQSLYLPEEELPDTEYFLEQRRFENFLGQQPARPQKSFTRNWYASAAAFAGFILVSLFFWWQAGQADLITYQTGKGEKSKVILPDNSVVYLNARSSLKVLKEWTGQTPREVWLEGEAYFDVNHHPAIGSAKFTVHTSEVGVEVLGTQFNVLEASGQTEVVLHSGKIQLDVKKDNRRLIMKPGDLVEVSKNNAAITKRLVNTEVYTAWKDSRFVFDNTTLADVAVLLESRYGARVTFTDSSLKERKFTFRMPDDNLELLLKTIAKSLDLQIIHQKEQIIIKPEPPGKTK
jgi:ferric-dicitrate binding protein FerR (iron transport regulator)